MSIFILSYIESGIANNGIVKVTGKQSKFYSKEDVNAILKLQNQLQNQLQRLDTSKRALKTFLIKELSKVSFFQLCDKLYQ